MLDGSKLDLRGVCFSAALAVVATVALTVSGSAFAQHGHGEHGGGMGMGMGMGWDKHSGGLMRNPERMGRMVDHMLDGLNATDAQRNQIKQIALVAGADIKAQRDSNRVLHEKAMQIFAAPNVDTAAAEQVRQQMLVQHDQMSQRSLQAVLDASKVLTPEQRATLSERIKQRSATMRERMKRMKLTVGERREAPKS